MTLTTSGSYKTSSIRELLRQKSCLRIMEAHSPLSALIIENASVDDEKGNTIEYDGFWSSSLTDSALIGKPDIELIDLNARITAIEYIFDVASKPLILDGDTGGKTEHFEYHIKTMERRGVSAVIIEDKCGLKKNSLFGNEVNQEQENVDIFCEKLSRGRAAKYSDEFMIIARIESLILEAGIEDALERATAYINAGADGIMIHSRKAEPTEVFTFASEFRKKHEYTPLVCVPTCYNQATFLQLRNVGFNVVIYANHMLRVSYSAMSKLANNVLENGRTQEIETDCLSINEILELIPGNK